MKLLLDENLSDRIPGQISPAFPGSSHVKTLGLVHEPDEVIWRFARDHGFAILTKDWDFHPMSLLRGFPPKVVFLSRANRDRAFMGNRAESAQPEEQIEASLERLNPKPKS